jgi:hypothetical protein
VTVESGDAGATTVERGENPISEQQIEEEMRRIKPG